MSLLIKNGTIVTTSDIFEADIFVEGGKIAGIGKNIANKHSNIADKVVDASNKYILPGAIDPHTHLAMPFMGTYSQDDYETGTIAAACGGITSIIDFDVQQKGESLLEAIERKKALAKGKAAIDFSSLAIASSSLLL